MRFLTDQRLFNNLIMVLQLCAAMRWAVAENTQQTVYWLAATALIFSITYL